MPPYTTNIVTTHDWDNSVNPDLKSQSDQRLLSICPYFTVCRLSPAECYGLDHTRWYSCWSVSLLVWLKLFMDGAARVLSIKKHNWTAPSENGPMGHARTAKASDRAVWSGPSLSANRIIDTMECINGEQRPGWDLAHAQDDMNLHILRMLKGSFSLGEAQLAIPVIILQEAHPNLITRL